MDAVAVPARGCAKELSGLPSANYWTDTLNTDNSNNSWTFRDGDGNTSGYVIASSAYQGNANSRAVCVP